MCQHVNVSMNQCFNVNANVSMCLCALFVNESMGQCQWQCWCFRVSWSMVLCISVSMSQCANVSMCQCVNVSMKPATTQSLACTYLSIGASGLFFISQLPSSLFIIPACHFSISFLFVSPSFSCSCEPVLFLSV